MGFSLRVPYINLILMGIFIDMSKNYNKEEMDAILHLEVCEYHSPSICKECNNIYQYFKKNYDIKSFANIYTHLSIKQKYSSLLYVDRGYFLKAFEPLLKRELRRYSYHNPEEREDLSQEGYIVLLRLFDKSKYRTINPAKFVSYIKRTFPLLLLQKYMKIKNRRDKTSCQETETLEYLAVEPNPFEDFKVSVDCVVHAAEKILTDMAYTIFLLFYKDGFKIADIAALLGVKTNYIINSLYYSRQHMKEHFDVEKE